MTKLIGYDCSPADLRRYAHREGHWDPRYRFRYPLREWGWLRDDCVARIRRAGLPVPVKSSCFFCTGMKAAELRSLPRRYLRLIVLIEARAAPRLRSVEGLWRKAVIGRAGAEPRPGSMTALIRAECLLEPSEIDCIIGKTAADLLSFQEHAARQPLVDRASMESWIEAFQKAARSR